MGRCTSLTSALRLMLTMSIQALSEKTGSMVRLANAMSTVEILSVTVGLTSEENEDKYLRGCSHECRVHPRNRYVEEHKMSQAEVSERLAVIGETLDGEPA